jgi:hypothetical protein
VRGGGAAGAAGRSHGAVSMGHHPGVIGGIYKRVSASVTFFVTLGVI